VFDEDAEIVEVPEIDRVEIQKKSLTRRSEVDNYARPDDPTRSQLPEGDTMCQCSRGT